MSGRSYEIEGRTVTMPVEVRDAGSGLANFLVPSARAQLLVGDAFEVAEFLPGRTLLMLGCIDYRDNDLGDYNEVVINFFVRQKGHRVGVPYVGPWVAMTRGTLPTYTYRMPVNQAFTQEVQGLGVSMGGRGFSLELGSHPLADDLRRLGLPKRPLMTLWFDKMQMRFGEAVPLGA